MDDAEDREKNLWLRKIREFIGYGLGWTFKDAFTDFILPKIMAGVLLFLAYILITHLHITIEWR